eukprot:TRINITY_DN795_c0_g2_i1.p1 TRINITY_DN795_c0_g2~~TRINITY_DN795_c0_g2_i1.p1  ORF type:complete len:372 (+),score=42.71 TRINITY_DN795_c0_g2_i1:110-1225(+)
MSLLFRNALRSRTTFSSRLTPSPLIFSSFACRTKPIPTLTITSTFTTNTTKPRLLITPVNLLHARQYSTNLNPQQNNNLPLDPLDNANNPNNPRLPLGTWKSLIKPILYSALALLFLIHIFVSETGRRQQLGARVAYEEIMQKRRYEKDFTPLGRVKHWWYNLGAPAKVQIIIMSLNTVVFFMWRSPPLFPIMTKYFMSSTLNPRFSTFILSSFSHVEGWHFLANMIAFYSFSSISTVLGIERFLCLYFASGIGASLASHLTRLAGRSFVPSLGASGCVTGLAGFLTCISPDTSFMFIFFPFVSFKASTLVTGLTIFETLGLLGILKRLGLKLNFDHAAHLAGLAIGYFWVNIILGYSKTASALINNARGG